MKQRPNRAKRTVPRRESLSAIYNSQHSHRQQQQKQKKKQRRKRERKPGEK